MHSLDCQLACCRALNFLITTPTAMTIHTASFAKIGAGEAELLVIRVQTNQLKSPCVNIQPALQALVW